MKIILLSFLCMGTLGAAVVENAPGYNAWPMIQAVDGKLICTYSRGSGHSIGEGRRDAFARVSADGGQTWGDEVAVSANPDEGEVMIGKGLDSSGAALFWVRCLGKTKHHDLYRTLDGVTFEKIASPTFEPFPMQVTDIVKVKRGLLCLWFQTNYKKDGKSSWGTLESSDDGRTWTQKSIEKDLDLPELPTEPSFVNLGDGRLLGIARTEIAGEKGGRQFQLTSTDEGLTWQKAKTNIGDIRISTPSLVYDRATGLVHNYYYERGKGKVKRRIVQADAIFARPTEWPEPTVVATGREERPHDAGNVNVTVVGTTHYLAYYYGTQTDAAVYVEPVRFLEAHLTAGASNLDFVDPLIGTEGKGSQYGGMMPYVGVPFGSFQLVPMTRLNRVGQLSFNQADDTLIGFILTRQPAIWMGDWGEVRIPIEPLKIKRGVYTPYRGEVAAGESVFEYTATAHAAWIRGTNLPWIRLMNGYCSNRDDENLGSALPNFKGWRYVRDLKDKGLQIGVSLISLEQAKRNLEMELGEKDFETVVSETKSAWERYFNRVNITASDDVKRIFYTGLYHTLICPRQIDEPSFAPSAATEAEVRHYYSAFDDKIHEGTMYNCYSLWDTYRAEHPWLTLIAPERVDGMMQSLLKMYREGGWLPKWPNPGYTGIMSGAPAEVVLAEACAKGFTGFDWKLAYEAVKKNATVPQALDRDRFWFDREEYGAIPETRGGLSYYQELGYVPGDRVTESVSRTQDFGLADCAAAVLAEATGHSDDAAVFRRRAKSYRNLWNAERQAFVPRTADGAWMDPEGRVKVPGSWPRGHYTEQTWKTGVWAVPFDTDGLAELLGGRERATRLLDEFFETVFWVPERGNKSIHGNEPSHHCAYLYNRFGHPEKTQQRVREILTKSYSTNRKGFDGNEDCGQMSAWYILSALGFYPLDPASGAYEIGSPLVESAELSFGAPYAETRLRITVRSYAPDRWRVRRVTLNGVELRDWRVKHDDLIKGGELVFEMM